MRVRICLAALVLAMGAAACGSSSSTTRQVLVDFNDLRFAAVMPAYFPSAVKVHPGDTVQFRQAWNGEPHSVTMGTLVDTALGAFDPVLPKLAGPSANDPDVTAHFQHDFANVPFMISFPTQDQVVQAGAQQCFLDRGVPPSDNNIPCPRRTQPAFNGRQAMYSSGFIPYAGNFGNTFTVKLASDIGPGRYRFFCTFHGPAMQGELDVVPKTTPTPSQSAVDHEALREQSQRSAAAAAALRGATSGPWNIVHAAQLANFGPPPPGAVAQGIQHDYFAGYGLAGPGAGPTGFIDINEFLPRVITAHVGQKVTWLLVGTHTVSVRVPRYFPQLAITSGGRVVFDHRADTPIGGPGFPSQPPSALPNPWIVDGGTWGGSGFRSSGLPPNAAVQGNQLVGFSLTFSRPGTYALACLIHPRMVASVIVKS
jgi:plastocyanin